jgi:hypothetical protein
MLHPVAAQFINEIRSVSNAGPFQSAGPLPTPIFLARYKAVTRCIEIRQYKKWNLYILLIINPVQNWHFISFRQKE